MVYTSHSGHAVEIAAWAATRNDRVIAVGGDGTVREVVAGLVQAGAGAHFGVIPAGTGNDFASMFEIPPDVGQAMQVLCTCHPHLVDYGRVRWDGPSGPGSTAFVNAAGMGIDGKVTQEGTRFKWMRGLLPYLISVIRVLRTWKSPVLRVDLYEGGRCFESMEEPMFLAMVGNGRRVGGGFYLTPDASITDGWFDACMVRDTSMRRVLYLLPRIVKGGLRGPEPEVVLCPVDAMEIRSDLPMPVQADGELLALEAAWTHVEIVRRGLSVVMPVLG